MNLASSVKQTHVVDEARNDEDRFVVKARQLMDASRLVTHRAERLRQVEELPEILLPWLHRHRDRIAKAFIAADDQGLTLVVVQPDVPADDELADRLTELELEVAGDDRFGLIEFAVRGMPFGSDEALHTYFRPGSYFRLDSGREG